MSTLFAFFTLYMVIILLFCSFFNQYIDLLFLGIVTFVVGSYVSFVNPRYYTFIMDDECYKLEGIKRFLIIDTIHILILLVVLYKYKHAGFNWVRFFGALCILILYLYLVNISQIYNLPKSEVFVVGIVTTFVYLSAVIENLV